MKLKKGFTLIEIVIVLAIAAIILVIVFIGVQGARRAQNDTQRRQDNARIAAQLESYASAHSGTYPQNNTEWIAFRTAYLNDGSFTDPNGSAYNFQAEGPAAACTTTMPARVYYDSINTRSFVLTMCLEGGGETIVRVP